MSAALQLAKPFLPKQVGSILDSQNQLKALEVELAYAKRNFTRFEVMIRGIERFANTWEMKLCSLEESQFFLKEWEKQLRRLEVDATKDVFNTMLDVSIRSLNAEKFRKRLANFKYEFQTVQLNCILEVSGLMLQLNTAALLPNPSIIIDAIRADYTEPCISSQIEGPSGTMWDQVPKDWIAAGQAMKAATPTSLSSLGGKAVASVAAVPASLNSIQKSFITPELRQSLNNVIA